MKIMNCPLNGPRNITEFVSLGEVRDMPDPATASDREWTTHLFLEPNTAGVIDEWWLHAPTNFWFIARRNTLTDEILDTITIDEYRASRGTVKGAGSEVGASEGGVDAGGMDAAGSI